MSERVLAARNICVYFLDSFALCWMLALGDSHAQRRQTPQATDVNINFERTQGSLCALAKITIFSFPFFRFFFSFFAEGECVMESSQVPDCLIQFHFVSSLFGCERVLCVHLS